MFRTTSNPARPNLIFVEELYINKLFRSEAERQFFYNILLQLLFGPSYPSVKHWRYEIAPNKLPLPHRQLFLFDLAYDLWKLGLVEFSPIRKRKNYK